LSWNTFTPQNTERGHRQWLHENLTHTEGMNGKFTLSYISRWGLFTHASRAGCCNAL